MITSFEIQFFKISMVDEKMRDKNSSRYSIGKIRLSCAVKPQESFSQKYVTGKIRLIDKCQS